MMICNWCPLAWECKLDKRNTSETYSLLNPSWGENQIVRTPADDQDCPLFRVFEQALGTGKAKKLKPDREKIAQIICCFYPDDPRECEFCKQHGGCPQWEDIIEQVDQIQALMEGK